VPENFWLEQVPLNSIEGTQLEVKSLPKAAITSDCHRCFETLLNLINSWSSDAFICDDFGMISWQQAVPYTCSLIGDDLDRKFKKTISVVFGFKKKFNLMCYQIQQQLYLERFKSFLMENHISFISCMVHLMMFKKCCKKIFYFRSFFSTTNFYSVEIFEPYSIFVVPSKTPRKNRFVWSA